MNTVSLSPSSCIVLTSLFHAVFPSLAILIFISAAWEANWPSSLPHFFQSNCHDSFLLLFSCRVISDSVKPYGLQHARLPCPSLSPTVWSNSCPLNPWWHPTITSSVIPFSSCFQPCPASGSFPMTQLFVSDGQSIGASASASVLPMNTQGWFPLGLAGGFPCCPRDSQEFSPAPQFESINFSVLSFLYGPTIISAHVYW